MGSVRVTIREARSFAQFTKAVEAIVEEATVSFKPEKLYIREMDASKTTMVEVSMPRDYFEDYDVMEAVAVGINFYEVSRILKRARRDDKLEIEVPPDGNVLKLRLIGVSTREFKLPSIVKEMSEEREVKLPVKARVVILSDEMKEIIKDIQLVGNEFTIESTRDEVKFLSEGDGQSVTINLRRGDAALLELEVEEELVKSTYGIEYVRKMMEGAKLAEKVTLEYATDAPLIMTFQPLEGGVLRYFLAPILKS